MARRVTSATLIGRTDELAAIDEAVASASAGRPQIVLVAGDAGVGKTRLISEACARAENDGVMCAVGGCVQLGETALAYAPIIEALRGVRRRLGDEDFAALLGPATGTVGVLLGTSEGSDVERSRLFEHLLGLVGRLGSRQPTLIVLEDMHWADASTRDFVAFLGRNLRDAPAALLLTYRGDELHPEHSWWTVLADLQRDARVERIALGGLGRRDLAALMAQLGTPSAPVDAVLRRTAGNPLYVEELVAGGNLSGAVPPTLTELILARVNRLPAPTPAVLHQAAVLGEVVDDEWLAELTARPLGEIIDALRVAVSHHVLIVHRVGFRFRHSLVRDALYDDLLPPERERLHARAARLLSDRQPRVPEHVRQTLLAYHASAAGDVDTAFVASVHAGLECERVYALSAAAVQYERALELWNRVTNPFSAGGMTRSQLSVRAAEALFFGSRSERTVGLLEEALTALPTDVGPRERVELLDRIAQMDGLLGRGEARLEAARRAVALVADQPPSPEKALALTSLGQTLMLRSQYREAEPLLRQAIAIADQVEARAVAGRALCYLATVLVGFGQADEAVTTHRRALQLSREYGTAVNVCVSYLNMCAGLVLCGRYDEAEEVGAEGVRYAIETGHTNFYAVAISGNRMDALYNAGRWREAGQVMAQFADQVPETSFWLHGIWLYVLIGQGRLSEARAIIAKLLEDSADAADVQTAAETLLCAGSLADAEERWDDARDFFRRGLELARASDDQYFASRGYANAIRAESRRIRSTAGRRAAADEVPQAQQTAIQLLDDARKLPARLAGNGIQLLPEPAAWLQTAETEYAAIDGKDTPHLWADLAKTWETVGQPFRRAEAQYREAEALLRQHGDRDRARERCAAALAVAERLSAVPLATEIRQLAQRGRLDLEPAPTKPERPAGLEITPREAEVLTLLTMGRTNREIAKTLFMSEKTASVHVSHLLRKLGVGTRVEAAAIAQRLGLTDADGLGMNGKPLPPA